MTKVVSSPLREDMATIRTDGILHRKMIPMTMAWVDGQRIMMRRGGGDP